jgi:large-conductance mechanosensitive channel
MNSLQILIYILIAIFYVWSAVRKAQRKQQPPQTNNEPGSAPKTFEELFRELQEAGKPKPTQPAPTPVQQKSQPVGQFTGNQARQEAEERIRKVQEEKEKMLQEIRQRRKYLDESYQSNETGSLETVDYDSQVDEYVKRYEATPVYENEASKVNYDNPSQSAYKGLDKGQKRFDEFETQRNQPHPLMTFLKDQNNLRNAFLFGEVFGRKYE